MIKIPPLGDYPPGYKPEVHGPYYPSRYYGKPDTPFGQVKLGELPGWLSRRSYTPPNIIRAVSRAAWKWGISSQAKHPTGVYINQLVVVYGIVFYINCYYKFQVHRHAKYH